MGLSIAGVFLLEGVIGALVWLAIVVRRGRQSRRTKLAERSAEQGLREEGEMTAYTSRSSFVDKWLGKEAAAIYTPVEIEESQPGRVFFLSSISGLN